MLNRVDFLSSLRESAGPEYDPEKSLLAAIIDQAVADLFLSRPERPKEAREWEENRRSALAFLFGAGSALEVYCEPLGLNADLIRKGVALRLAEAGIGPDAVAA